MLWPEPMRMNLLDDSLFPPIGAGRPAHRAMTGRFAVAWTLGAAPARTRSCSPASAVWGPFIEAAPARRRQMPFSKPTA